MVDLSASPLPTIKVVCCYEHHDKALKDSLISHLSVFTHNQPHIILLNEFGKKNDWQKEIKNFFKPDYLFLLLISAQFIHEYLYIDEMKQAIDNQIKGKVPEEIHFLPIIARECAWHETYIRELNVLPSNKIPVKNSKNIDSVFNGMNHDIRQAVVSLLQPLYILEAKKFEKAEDTLVIYDKTIGLDKERKYEPAIYGKAESLFALGHLEQSKTCLQGILDQDVPKGLELQILQAKAFHLIAKIYSSWRNYEESDKNYDRFLEVTANFFLSGRMHPEICKAYQEKIEVLKYLGKIDEALKTYGHLITFDSNNAAGHLLRKGQLLETLEYYDKALLAYDEAIEKDSHQAEFHHKKGELLLRLRRYHQAIEAYNKSIELDPQQPLFYQNLGLAHLEAGHYQQALAIYKKCLDLEIELDQFDYYRKGRAHFHLKEYGKALLDFDTAIELGGEDIYPKFYRYKKLTLNALQQEASRLETQAQVLWKNKETEGFLFINTTQPENFVFLFELLTSSTAVRQVVFNSNIDEIYLASIDSSSYSVKLWNMRTVDKNQKPFYIPQPFSEDSSSHITDIVFGSDEKLVAANGDVKLWNLHAEQLSSIQPESHANKVIFCSNEQYGQLLACANEQAIEVWKYKDDTWEKLAPLPNLSDGGNVLSIAFSPDGQFLAYGNDLNLVWIYSLLEGNWHPLTGHKGSVNSLVFSPNGQLLASGSRDKSIKIWDSHSMQELYTLLPEENPSPVLCLAYSPDGQVLASGNDDNTIRLWNPDTDQELRAPLTGHTNSVLCLAFSPDGQFLASGSADGTIKVWGKK